MKSFVLCFLVGISIFSVASNAVPLEKSEGNQAGSNWINARPRQLDENDETEGDFEEPVVADENLSDDDIEEVPQRTNEIDFASDEDEWGILNFTSNSENEHNRNFMKISANLKEYEESYKKCLRDIPESDYALNTVYGCVGQNFENVYDNIQYEKFKIISRADETIRKEMIHLCYNPAGSNMGISDSCDLIEVDALDLLWSEMNFHFLLDYNRDKYVFIQAKIPDDIFTNVLNKFKSIYTEIDQLVTELYNHRDLTIAYIKREIDERSGVIAEKLRKQALHPKPVFKKDIISVTEKLLDSPRYHLDLDHLPRPMIENGSDQMYAMDNNPWVEDFAHNIGPNHYASINNPSETPNFDNPLYLYGTSSIVRNLEQTKPDQESNLKTNSNLKGSGFGVFEDQKERTEQQGDMLANRENHKD